MKAAALLAALLAAGCATMVNGTSQQIPVTSSPAHAAITLACAGEEPRHAGYTPATIRLRRDASGCSITLSKLGYREETIRFHRTRSAATALNAVPGLVLGGVTGLIAYVPLQLIIGPENAEAAGDAAFNAGAAVPDKMDEKSGAAWKHIPERVDVDLIRRP